MSCFLLIACGETKDKSDTDSVSATAKDSFYDQGKRPSFPASQNIEAKTFEVKDSTGKSQGWGYDLYIDGKRSIHQPIFPGLRGNNSFQRETDALKMGQLAANRMKTTGALPTIFPNDFDSLGIQLPKDLQHIVDSLIAVGKREHQAEKQKHE